MQIITGPVISSYIIPARFWTEFWSKPSRKRKMKRKMVKRAGCVQRSHTKLPERKRFVVILEVRILMWEKREGFFLRRITMSSSTGF